MSHSATSVTSAAVVALLLAGFSGRSASAGEFRLNDLPKPLRLHAIPRADNGRLVGMAATLGDSYLGYRAFRGRLSLRYVGQFDENRLLASKARRYAPAMGGAAIYRIENADEFLAGNRGRLLLGPDAKPAFVTVKQGHYLDGKGATWVCVLSSTSIEAFYSTQIGHDRCDAFR